MKYAVDSWNLLVQLKAAWSDLFQIVCSLLNDSFAEYVYKNKHCNSFPGQINRIPMRKKYTKLVANKLFIQGYCVILPLYKDSSPTTRQV